MKVRGQVFSGGRRMRTGSGPRVVPDLIGGDPFGICAYEPWMQYAACLDIDPELFFPCRGDSITSNRAKKICADCPVRSECLTYALKRHEPYGIWGGKSYQERTRKAVSV